MAKFHCVVGYVRDEETSAGVYNEVVTEKSYSCDVLRNIQRWESGEQLNDNLTINNRFSIVADEFALTNLNHIRYLTWQSVKWEVTSIEVQRPRLVLSVGGVFNE